MHQGSQMLRIWLPREVEPFRNNPTRGQAPRAELGRGREGARALPPLTCPARGVLEKVGKIVARREASADRLPPLEVAREPGVARRAGLKVRELSIGRRAGVHLARRRAGTWRTPAGPAARPRCCGP